MVQSLGRTKGPLRVRTAGWITTEHGPVIPLAEQVFNPDPIPEWELESAGDFVDRGGDASRDSVARSI